MLALLMLAAPAGDVVAEAAETASYAASPDDDTVTGAIAVALDATLPRVVHLPRAAETTRPAPALARVFRPPRPAFD